MRIALIAVLTLLVAAPSAQAAATKITWPAKRQYAPGDTVKVTVASERRVKVSVVRTNAAGKPIAAVARRTLKRGTLIARLERAGTYAVRVDERTRALTVLAPAAPPGPAPVTPPSVPIDAWDCTRAANPRLAVQLGALSTTPGTPLPFTVQNVSDGCLVTGVGYGLEHLEADGTWTPKGFTVFPAVAVLIPLGDVQQRSVYVPADAPLGTYRLSLAHAAEPVTFEVLAAG